MEMKYLSGSAIVSALIFAPPVHEARATAEPVTLHEYYLVAPGGQRIPVGHDAIRKRC